MDARKQRIGLFPLHAGSPQFFLEHLGFDAAGDHRIDANGQLLRRAFQRKHAGQRIQPRLADAIGGKARCDPDAEGGRDVDNAAGLAIACHQPDRRTAAHEGAAQVDVHMLVPVGVVGIGQIGADGDPGAIDQHVETTVMLIDPGDDIAPLGIAGGVECDPHRIAADLRCGGVGLVDGARCQHDRCAFFCKAPGDGESDALGRTGDERNLSCQPVHSKTLSSLGDENIMSGGGCRGVVWPATVPRMDQCSVRQACSCLRPEVAAIMQTNSNWKTRNVLSNPGADLHRWHR